ncbi:hypothetical protein DFH06DRAFT_1200964 [Mycena polygramma]|nr:hypothetical protein DFH06DRAFT_1200964 [Mycena polygramma]
MSSPMILTHICRHWREIALAMPTLWRAISFYSYTNSAQRPIVDVWLERSRYYPLSIVIHTRRWSVSEILAAIVPYQARWEHIEFSISPSDLHTIVGPMPLLQHLDLSVGDEVSLPVEFFDVPKLRTAVLGQHGTSNITLPWAQLTGLTLNTVLRDEYIAILRQTPNLRRCDLEIFNSDNMDPPHELTLPRLESLTICNAYSGMRASSFLLSAASRSQNRSSRAIPSMC